MGTVGGGSVRGQRGLLSIEEEYGEVTCDMVTYDLDIFNPGVAGM